MFMVGQARNGSANLLLLPLCYVFSCASLLVVDIAGDGSVLFVNLIDNKKQEGMLGAAFHEAVEASKKHVHRYLRSERFDFHKACSKMRGHNLPKHINEIADRSERRREGKESDRTG